MAGTSSLRHALIFSIVIVVALLAACASRPHQEGMDTTSDSPVQASLELRKTAPAPPARPSSESETDPALACLNCHQYRENHHPVDFAPADPSRISFPLYDGKIKCLTCHHEDHQIGIASLLRGGPYADRRGICFRCHHEGQYAEIYPHVMLDGDGKIMELNGQPVCLVCHSRTPNPAVDRTRDVVFRADVAFLCWRCHSLMATPMLHEHVLLTPRIAMRRHIEQSELRMQVTIPLVPRERITCSTCHNPHQKGVITYEPSAKGADSPDKLRLQAPGLCLACHEM